MIFTKLPLELTYYVEKSGNKIGTYKLTMDDACSHGHLEIVKY